MMKIHRLLLLLLSAPSFLSPVQQAVAGFAMPGVTAAAAKNSREGSSSKSFLKSASSDATTVCAPSEREATYGSNVAQYLVDLHNAKATFDFCGGMMFQLVLTDKLREHLVKVAANNKSGSESKEQPVLFDASMPRMHQIPNYETNDKADNVCVFHGREIRQVKDAAGGMGMVLQLSLANADDKDGWTPQEIAGYDGWKHDVGRVWRNGKRLQDEGFVDFPKKFGPNAFTLNHRFYLHLDRSGAMWLAAEDGCEGTPSQGRSLFSPLSKLLGM